MNGVAPVTGAALFVRVDDFDDICTLSMETQTYLQYLPEEFAMGLKEGEFNNPFRYEPCAAVREAASGLMARIGESPFLSEAFRPGKMMGVLVVRDASGRLGYLSGFSGLAAGKSRIEGFVPPIFDLTETQGHYRKMEQEISGIVCRLRELESDCGYLNLQSRLSEARSQMSLRLNDMRSRMECSRRARETERETGAGPERLAELVKQSQFEKAEYKRVKKRFEQGIAELESGLTEYSKQIGLLRQQHRALSDSLQKWIFDHYIVHNSCGEEVSVWDIFAANGLVPPGGTGDCAAPKLLEFAFRNGLKPLAMGEFWYGQPSRTAVRVQGHFYPSCTSKCGPLLGFMLKGLKLVDSASEVSQSVQVIHSDNDIIVVSKPSGMPSVPGLDGRLSVLDYLKTSFGEDVYPVHRLDMDTSGVMVYARTPEAQANLQKQFEERTVSKTYRARLCPPDMTPSAPDALTMKSSETTPVSAEPQSGTISLPLSPDYDERPRQKVDFHSGKEAVTEYRILGTNSDGTTDIDFHPLTGRTHQLRVHSAHALGIGRPIAGDLLYGGFFPGVNRLCLHACSLAFFHPTTGKRLVFEDSK